MIRRRYAVSTWGGARRTYFSASAALSLSESLLRNATAWSSVGATGRSQNFGPNAVQITCCMSRPLGARRETPTTFERRCIPPERRCSSVEYGQYAPSSRLVSRAPHHSRCYTGFHHGLLAQTLRPGMSVGSAWPLDHRPMLFLDQLSMSFSAIPRYSLRARARIAFVEGRYSHERPETGLAFGGIVQD